MSQEPTRAGNARSVRAAAIVLVASLLILRFESRRPAPPPPAAAAPQKPAPAVDPIPPKPRTAAAEPPPEAEPPAEKKSAPPPPSAPAEEYDEPSDFTWGDLGSSPWSVSSNAEIPAEAVVDGVEQIPSLRRRDHTYRIKVRGEDVEHVVELTRHQEKDYVVNGRAVVYLATERMLFKYDPKRTSPNWDPVSRPGNKHWFLIASSGCEAPPPACDPGPPKPLAP
jgi:hypothetical protein